MRVGGPICEWEDQHASGRINMRVEDQHASGGINIRVEDQHMNREDYNESGFIRRDFV